MRTASPRTVRAGVVLLGLVALSACGPMAPFDVGTQSAPVDLILGEHEAVVEAPVGPISQQIPAQFAPFFPTVTPPKKATSAAPATSEAPVVPSSSAPVVGCPDLDPLAPTVGVTPAMYGPPGAATYVYRGSSTDTVGSKTATYKGDTTWTVTVAPQDATSGGYDVTLTVEAGTTKTSRVLRILPDPVIGASTTDPNATNPNTLIIGQYNANAAIFGLPLLPALLPNVGSYGPGGVYLVSQTTGDGTFTPSTPMPLIQTPVTQGNTVTAVGSDSLSSMTYTATVTQKAQVNACGNKEETWEVELTNGLIGGRASDGSTQVVNFSETLDFGLQYGGIPLHDAGTVTGAVGAGTPDTVSRSFDFTINSEPLPSVY